MKYLILFDIDGTILRMKKGMAKKLFSDMMNDIFEVEVPDHAMPGFAGMTDLRILRLIAENINYPYEKMLNKLAQVQETMRLFFVEVCTKEFIDILPGVEELLERLEANPDVVLGLVTGNFKENAYIKLDTHDLGRYFETGAFGDDAEDRNHLPEVAIARANDAAGGEYFHSGNSIIIGDTQNDIHCAHINNIPAIAVATGPVKYDALMTEKPEAILENLADTGKVIDLIYEILNNHEKNKNSN